MNQPFIPGRVSTIVAVYNLAPYIEAAVRSVQVQQIDDLEIVVVDDGSTDNTSEIVQDLAADDPRIRLTHQPNRGAAAARNIGIEAATGEFITFLDGDDLYDPGKLSRQLEVMAEYPAVGLVFHDLCRFESDPADRAGAHLHRAQFLARVGEPVAFTGGVRSAPRLGGAANGWCALFRRLRSWPVQKGISSSRSLGLAKPRSPLPPESRP